jgi:hypothetical protein
LSANEIEAARLADQGGRFNPQQQFPVSWPAEPVVARAYVDQLRRGTAVPAATLDDVSAALDLAALRLESGASDRELATRLTTLARGLGAPGADAVTQKRTRGLGETLSGLAARLSR